MHNLVLALHLLFVIFAVGPLVHSATTASRGVRNNDAAAVTGSSRMARIYSYASVLAVLAGFGLVQKKWHADFGDTWVWLSVLLWLVAVVIVLAVLVPSLDRAASQIRAEAPVTALVGRVAASGGVIGLIFAAIVFLMVYRPGGH